MIVLDGFTGFTPIQNKLMQKLMLYAGKVMVTLTVDSREDPFRAEGEHHLFYLSKKTAVTLKRLAAEAGVPLEEPRMVKPSGKSRLAQGGALFWLEQNLFRFKAKPWEGEQKEIELHVLRNPQAEAVWAASGSGAWYGKRLSLPGFCHYYRQYGGIRPLPGKSF